MTFSCPLKATENTFLCYFDAKCGLNRKRTSQFPQPRVEFAALIRRHSRFSGKSFLQVKLYLAPRRPEISPLYYKSTVVRDF